MRSPTWLPGRTAQCTLMQPQCADLALVALSARPRVLCGPCLQSSYLSCYATTHRPTPRRRGLGSHDTILTRVLLPPLLGLFRAVDSHGGSTAVSHAGCDKRSASTGPVMSFAASPGRRDLDGGLTACPMLSTNGLPNGQVSTAEAWLKRLAGLSGLDSRNSWVAPKLD